MQNESEIREVLGHAAQWRNPIRLAAARMLAAGTDTRPILRGATSRPELVALQAIWIKGDAPSYAAHQGAKECAKRRRLAEFRRRVAGASPCQ